MPSETYTNLERPGMDYALEKGKARKRRAMWIVSNAPHFPRFAALSPTRLLPLSGRLLHLSTPVPAQKLTTT